MHRQHQVQSPYLELNVPPPCCCANSTMDLRTEASHALAMSTTDMGSGSPRRVRRKAASAAPEISLNLFLQPTEQQLINMLTIPYCKFVGTSCLNSPLSLFVLVTDKHRRASRVIYWDQELHWHDNRLQG